ncbi:sulfur carrier protein ThiS [Desulfuribacillus alkaliarsenatis]|uniref:Thiamine biosynthesis protein ThiS n=1 Tax=Desulfuribacillus alkaliarsenatis TaxID=766136 RepID=A0A1E5G016_9FIRM|nr:sulfur carrier protein ThiS [Desulfuribacillus alkaliarsenatis]OEF96185.1 thiamine biosynthesis protein ThiS [Desulfuribacillus alkaliarsenatis]
MIIVVNGKEVETSETGISIMGFINSKGLCPEQVVVEHNGQVVECEQWEQIKLQDNDHLEVLRFVGGG